MDKEITVNGVDYIAELSWTFDGKYRPATREAPEETPDCLWEVQHVWYADTNRSVTDEKIISAVENALNDIAEEVSGEIEEFVGGC